MSQLPALIEKMKPEFERALSKQIDVERFARIALTSFRRTPALTRCDPNSILGALMTCAQLRIEPDSVMGQAYLVPYGKECTLIVGYQGLQELARRSGDIADIYAEVVYEGDEFEETLGTNRGLHHKRTPRTKYGEEHVTHAYSVVVFKDKDAPPSHKVLTRDQIERIRVRSKAGSKGPWKTDWEEMAKKTVFRNHSKWIRKSPDLREAIALNDAAEFDFGKKEELPVQDFLVEDITETKPMEAHEPMPDGSQGQTVVDEEGRPHAVPPQQGAYVDPNPTRAEVGRSAADGPDDRLDTGSQPLADPGPDWGEKVDPFAGMDSQRETLIAAAEQAGLEGARDMTTKHLKAWLRERNL